MSTAPIRAVVAAALVLAGLTGLAALAAPASAAVISGAITDVTVTPTSITNGSKVRTDIDWCVPNGSHAGDTFTLTLPDGMGGYPAGFPLKDPQGNLVANAVIAGDPAVATFTLTNYVESHNNTCGTAFFWSNYQGTPGTTEDVSFTTNDHQTFTSQITIAPAFQIDNSKPYKFGGFVDSDQCRTITEDCLRWRLQTQVGPIGSGTITDDASAGITFSCDNLSLVIGDPSTSWPYITNTTPYAGASVSCSATSLSVSYGAVPAGKKLQVTLYGTPDQPGGDGGVTYENTARFSSTLNGVTTVITRPTSVTSNDAGGDGEGDTDTGNETLNRPTITTETSADRVKPGARIADTVTVKHFAKGSDSTGTVQLFGPYASRSGATCEDADLVATKHFTPRNGTFRTGKVRVAEPGYYTWVASLTADEKNESATHRCGLAKETTLVAKPRYIAPVVATGFDGRTLARAAVAGGFRLRYAAIGASAPVERVGISGGEMGLPSDVDKVAYLKRSAGVGDLIGSTIIAGHVSDLHDVPGAFARLASAKKGQRLTVTEGGHRYRFRVVSTARYSRSHALPQRLFSTTGRHKLVLISCTGRISLPGGHFHYTQNQVVTAVPVR